MCCRRGSGPPSSQPLPHPVGRAEPLMGPRRLLSIVGRRVPPHHCRRAVSQQVLHVQLPCLVLYRPGGKGVPKAVHLHLLHPCPLAQPPQKHQHRMRTHPRTMPRQEQWTRLPTPTPLGSSCMQEPVTCDTTALALSKIGSHMMIVGCESGAAGDLANLRFRLWQGHPTFAARPQRCR